VDLRRRLLELLVGRVISSPHSGGRGPGCKYHSDCACCGQKASPRSRSASRGRCGRELGAIAADGSAEWPLLGVKGGCGVSIRRRHRIWHSRSAVRARPRRDARFPVVGLGVQLMQALAAFRYLSRPARYMAFQGLIPMAPRPDPIRPECVSLQDLTPTVSRHLRRSGTSAALRGT